MMSIFFWKRSIQGEYTSYFRSEDAFGFSFAMVCNGVERVSLQFFISKNGPVINTIHCG